MSAHSFVRDDVGSLSSAPSILPLVSAESMDSGNDVSNHGGNLLNVKMSPGGSNGNGSEMDKIGAYVVDHQPPPKKLFSDDIPVL